MKNWVKFGLMFALASLLASQARAQNHGPPNGPVVLDLNGLPIPTSYQEYTTPVWTATMGTTNISFAMRDDPAFLFLDDVTMRNVTTGNPVTVTNGGFELGPVGASAPTGWSYLNTFGATFGGVVENFAGEAHSGSNFYYDGAVQAYDAITQAIPTVVGDQYTISFWLMEDSGNDIFRRLSTNGQAGTGGNGIDVVVYAGVLPSVPEPSSLTLLGTGLAIFGIVMVRRRKKVA